MAIEGNAKDDRPLLPAASENSEILCQAFSPWRGSTLTFHCWSIIDAVFQFATNRSVPATWFRSKNKPDTFLQKQLNEELE